MAHGFLVVKVYAETIAQPVEGAIIEITGDNVKKTLETNMNGISETIDLPAPDKQYSLYPQEEIRPYSTYTLKVSKDGLETTSIEGVEILPDETSIQEVYLKVDYGEDKPTTIVLPEHVLWGDYPPKIVEEPIKDESGPPLAETRVLIEPIVPEYIIVHDGTLSNTNAARYYITFPDYIKNVASSEIYATWPRETIKANVYAILSFTMNRIFTEWYRSRGYNFTITSSTSYDQKYTHGRTIFATISNVVDEIFREYIKLPNLRQPFLAQYNDGIKVNNPGWLSQWGSKDLGDRGYSALNILKYYYGNQVSLATAREVEGLPTSFPGFNLRVGSCSEAVQKMQNQLNVIAGNYPAIPKLVADGIFGEATKKSVEKFQSIFSLPVDGVVGFATWYKISYIYIAVAKLMQGATT